MNTIRWFYPYLHLSCILLSCQKKDSKEQKQQTFSRPLGKNQRRHP
jgi:hypothetical protein